jgi:hypothetical protein
MYHFRQFLSLCWLILCLQGPIWANLASDTVYLTWQKDPTTTMVIQWLTLADHDQTHIEYRALNEKEWLSATGKQFALPYSPNHLVHRLELINLLPNQSYQFKVAGQEKVRLFRTMPSNLESPIHFVVGGDMYHDNDATQGMCITCRQAAQTDPDFAVLGGDIAYAVMSNNAPQRMERWIEWIRAWSQNMVTEEGRLIPVLAAVGNHDVINQFGQTPAQAKVFKSLFPRHGEKLYNVMDFGNYLSLFLLDSGHTSPIRGAQTNWLKTSLEERQDKLYRLAAYHVPAYPSIRDFNNRYSKAIRRNWVPVFENKDVQMAFEHHDHAYKRTFPLLKGKPQTSGGVVYVGDGAWSIQGTRQPIAQERPYLAKFNSSRHFISVKLDQDKLFIRSIEDVGNILDRYTHKRQPVSKAPNKGSESWISSLFSHIF